MEINDAKTNLQRRWALPILAAWLMGCQASASFQLGAGDERTAEVPPGDDAQQAQDPLPQGDGRGTADAGEAPFVCASGDAISPSWLCDGEADCPGGEDELGDACEGDGFACDDVGYIDAAYVCDGDADCADGSDERDCGTTGDTITCADGEQIPMRWACDGEQDCAGGDDERDCAPLTFVCADGEEIPADWVCDAEADCSGAGDEADC